MCSAVGKPQPSRWKIWEEKLQAVDILEILEASVSSRLIRKQAVRNENDDKKQTVTRSQTTDDNGKCSSDDKHPEI